VPNQGRLASQGAGELHAMILQWRIYTLEKLERLSNPKPNPTTPEVFDNTRFSRFK